MVVILHMDAFSHLELMEAKRAMETLTVGFELDDPTIILGRIVAYDCSQPPLRCRSREAASSHDLKTNNDPPGIEAVVTSYFQPRLDSLF